MAAGYVRQREGDWTDGNVLTASMGNDEFNAVEDAMNSTTGHTHDGTTGGGAIIQSKVTINAQTGTYSTVAGDLGKVVDCTSGTFTVTLIAAATAGSGHHLWVRNSGSGTITVDGNSSETIDGSATISLAQYEAVHLECDGSNWKILADLRKTIQQGIHEFSVPASAMVGRTTNGAAAGTTETTTNDVMLSTMDFDQTTAEAAQFSLPMPKSWNEGTFTFVPYWTAASGTGDVMWSMAGVALSNDDLLDTAFGTVQTSTDTLIATTDLMIGPESSAITIAGTPAANDMVFFQIARVPGDAADTLNADAKLLGVRIRITIDAATDV